MLNIHVDTNQLRIYGFVQTNVQITCNACVEQTIEEFYNQNLMYLLTNTHNIDGDDVRLINEVCLIKSIDRSSLYANKSSINIFLCEYTKSFQEICMHKNIHIENEVYLTTYMFGSKFFGFRIKVTKNNMELMTQRIVYIISGDETLMAIVMYCKTHQTMEFIKPTLCVNGKYYSIATLIKDCFAQVQNMIEIDIAYFDAVDTHVIKSNLRTTSEPKKSNFLARQLNKIIYFVKSPA